MSDATVMPRKVVVVLPLQRSSLTMAIAVAGLRVIIMDAKTSEIEERQLPGIPSMTDARREDSDIP